MNKLQKLFENNIEFSLRFDPYTMGQNGRVSKTIAPITWAVFERSDKKYYTQTLENGRSDNIKNTIEQLWQAAKKHYPDAACFKEESNG